MTALNPIAPFSAKDWLLDDIISYQPITSGFENSCTQLLIGDGSSYLLKMFSGKDRYYPELECELVQQLSKTIIATPNIQMDATGSLIVERSGKYAILYHWINGSAPKLTSKIIDIMVNIMVEIHDTATPRYLRRYHYTAKQFIEDVQNDWSLLSPVHHILASSRTAMEEFNGYTGSKVLCHADIQTRNLIISHQGLPVIIDFEHAAFEPREFDLARTIVFACAEGPFTLQDLIVKVLRAHKTARPSVNIDSDLLHILLIYSFAMVIYWRYRAFNILNINPSKRDIFKTLIPSALTLLKMNLSEFSRLIQESK